LIVPLFLSVGITQARIIIVLIRSSTETSYSLTVVKAVLVVVVVVVTVVQLVVAVVQL
jgi:hypothetical protein